MDKNGDIPTNSNIYIQDEKLFHYKTNNNIGSTRASVSEQEKLLPKETLNDKNALERILNGENDSDNKVDGIVKDEHEIGNQVDTPWSFAIGIVSFIAQSFLGGYVYTGGIYYMVFRDVFPDTSTVSMSWLCTLPLTLWFIGSPIGSVLTNRFGCRICSLIGGIMAAVGLSLCYVATNFYMVFAFYGLLAGFGNGIMYVGYVTSVSRYFRKYRTLITILTTIGPTFGMALYSVLIPYLTGKYGWRGCLLVLGGLSFNLCVCACVLFPIKSPLTTKKKCLLDVSILRTKYFIPFCLQVGFANLSNSMVLLHLPSLIISYGLGSTISSLSLAVYGVSNSIGKVIYSVFGHFANADVTTVFALSLFMCGVAMALAPALSYIEWILVFSGILGFTFNVTGGHSLEVILDITGQEHFSDGVGLSQIFKAAGTLLAGPLAGILYETCGNYKVTFYTSGCLMSTSCLLMVPAVVNKLRPSTKPHTHNNNITITVPFLENGPTKDKLNKISNS